MLTSNLSTADPIIAKVIKEELSRQEHTIDLIASENYAPLSVLQAAGSVLTNKYAEGYPNKRYYGGCQIVDQAELVAIERCKKLFGAEHVNVQPHAGSQANMAAYFAVLNPGDTILGMSLAEGGHLTHGHSVNFSGKIFKSIQYTVNKETELLDFNQISDLAHKYKPKLIIAGASAYSRIIDFEQFATIAKSVNAYFLADIAHIAGLIAAKLHPNPVSVADLVTSTTHKTLRGPRGGLAMCKENLAQQLDRAIMPGLQGGPFMNVIAAKAICFELALQQPFVDYQKQIIANAQIMAKKFIDLGYRVVTGGTDNHLFVLDLRVKNLVGKVAQELLESVDIIVSRSTIPFDPQSPFITSGIRIGTPAVTSRGMQERELVTITHLIDEAIRAKDDQQKLGQIKIKVHEICKKFPIY